MHKGTEEVILRRKDLANRYGCTLWCIDAMHRNKTLPPGRYLPGQLRPFWYLSEIEANELKAPLLRKNWGNNKPKPKPAPDASQAALQF